MDRSNETLSFFFLIRMVEPGIKGSEDNSLELWITFFDLDWSMEIHNVVVFTGDLEVFQLHLGNLIVRAGPVQREDARFLGSHHDINISLHHRG